MKKWMKILGILAALGVAGAIVGYVFVYNKSHPDYEKKTAKYVVSAEELFFAFKKDEMATSNQFNGQLIEITGIMNEVEATDESRIVYMVLGEGMFGNEGVRISMMASQNEACDALSVGKQITVKGLCVGYNETDVIIQHGTLTKF
ncbi:MAG: hypothetical protein Q8S18_12025 [Bacteroidales bacterium]|nr:hypothetical protein [Bacteroidales bacterium]